MKNAESSVALDTLIDGLEVMIGAGLELNGGNAPKGTVGYCASEELCSQWTCKCYVD